MTSMRKVAGGCPKCGASPQEYCRHSAKDRDKSKPIFGNGYVRKILPDHPVSSEKTFAQQRESELLNNFIQSKQSMPINAFAQHLGLEPKETMTLEPIKHLQKQTDTLIFDCLYTTRHDNNSDTFWLAVTHKDKSYGKTPRHAIIEMCGNWEMRALMDLCEYLEGTAPDTITDREQTQRAAQNYESRSMLPDADMMMLQRHSTKWNDEHPIRFDVLFNYDGTQESYAASYGGEGDNAYTIVTPAKPFFHLRLKAQQDLDDVIDFLKDPFALPQIGEYESVERTFGVVLGNTTERSVALATQEHLNAVFEGDENTQHLIPAMASLIDRFNLKRGLHL